MALNGNHSYTSVYGDRIDFSWYVESQSGMSSTIKWTAVYSAPGCNYVDVNSNMYITFYPSGEKVIRNILFMPEEAYTTYVGSDVSLKRVCNESHATQYGSYYSEACTSITKTGTFTVTREDATNLGSFSVAFSAHSGEGEEEAKEYYYRSINTGPYIGNSLYYIPALGSESYDVNTTTKYGSGAKINSVTWDNDEQDPVITYSYDKGSSVSSATLEACISFTGATDNIPYRQISATGSSYTFNLTQEERETLWTLLHKGSTATVRLKIKTTEIVNRETMIIENYVTKTVQFINYKPIIKPTIIDVNPATIALTGGTSPDGYPILVRYMSKAQYNMNVELRKGGLDVIGSYVQNGGKIEEGFLEGTFDYPESNTFYFSATDDRGHTGTASQSFEAFYGEWIGYVKLTSSVKCTPISGEGDLTVTVSGKYFDGWFSNNNPNTMKYQYAIYPRGTDPVWSDIIDVTPTMDGSDYTFSFDYSVGLNYTKQHNVEIRVIDRLMTSEVTTTAVSRPVFYWGKDEFTFNVPVTFDSDIVIGGVSLLELLRDKGWIE